MKNQNSKQAAQDADEEEAESQMAKTWKCFKESKISLMRSKTRKGGNETNQMLKRRRNEQCDGNRENYLFIGKIISNSKKQLQAVKSTEISAILLTKPVRGGNIEH